MILNKLICTICPFAYQPTKIAWLFLSYTLNRYIHLRNDIKNNTIQIIIHNICVLKFIIFQRVQFFVESKKLIFNKVFI